ncbi:DUF3301 domain-containing protein [Denitratisoma oestradiolicum]|uniref:DUF3301 domain-containing protein n=1 Tax=Denitratisoma oestradiolicum TaxID=311182 RepID=A0A6S6Y0M6_9PROT|nr:DUF3301 domain-containing protein [Denitratisoma oestradiolicum]TWO80128.1 hypothetical protein CBW56_11190 [Denitratisoma oestradiolicum]CAB1370035.1 conserved protein of unknown function [Denitratisoma oestradiolicum]
MPVFETLSLMVIAVLGWLWLDSFKAHEAGINAARSACESENLQLLDETVFLNSLRMARNDDGQVVLRRVYQFEYSDTGDNRRRGSVMLLGHKVIVVNVGLRPVSSDRTLH